MKSHILAGSTVFWSALLLCRARGQMTRHWRDQAIQTAADTTSSPIPCHSLSPENSWHIIPDLQPRREGKGKTGISSYHFCSTYYVPGIALGAYIWDLFIFTVTVTWGCRRYHSHVRNEDNTNGIWAIHQKFGTITDLSNSKGKGQLCAQILSQL